MSNELTDVRCPCGAEFQADSYDAGFIAGSGMCQNCDAALPPKDICTCPSGDGSLRHPCPVHPASVEQAGGDERDFQAKGAQEVPSPVSKEYDRHLIGLLRKGEALPGHQEEAADEIERLRDWNDHLNNTVLPNILNPNFLMLMKGGERLLDLCTKDGKFIGVSLNDMKDVFDWMVTHARIAPDHAALAQPSPAQAEQAEAERPAVVGYRSMESGMVYEQDYGLKDPEALTTVAECDSIVGELRAKIAQLRQHKNDYMDAGQETYRALQNEIREREAEIARLDGLVSGRTAERDAALARVAELEKKLAMALDAASKGDAARHAACGMEMEIQELKAKLADPTAVHQWQFSNAWFDGSEEAVLKAGKEGSPIRTLYTAPAQAQHSVPEGLALIPVRETEAMHDAVMALLYKGVARTDTQKLLDAYIAAAPGKEVPQAWLDVQAERRRQITAEGWTPEHDDEHDGGQIAQAAGCYALHAGGIGTDWPDGRQNGSALFWPWDKDWWKPTTPRRDLVKACALALAEIERLDRAAHGKEGV